MISDAPIKHIYARCLKCDARWWYMTLPMSTDNLPHYTTCPNCYAKGKQVMIAFDDQHSEYKPERKE